MPRRPITIACLALALAACAEEAPPMWKGADLSAPLTGLPPPPAYPARPWAPPSQAPSPTQFRLGSGSPPDLLRGPAETIRPPTSLPSTVAPLSPAAPPSPLDSPAFLRTGPIANGPGGVYNSVGSTIFGPGGKVCTPVGSSLTCL